jgi:hypothetical protein
MVSVKSYTEEWAWIIRYDYSIAHLLKTQASNWFSLNLLNT